MKQIKKGKPPASLTEHEQKEYADYDNYPDKDDLRISLTTEQRGICCYCMGPIKPDIKYIKIEHFKCQDNYPDEQLKYPNLLGACKGNEGNDEELTHCDTFKGNKDLSIYPPWNMPNVDTLFEYNNDGTIWSANKTANTELKDVLNLNAPILIKNRKATLDGFKDFLETKYAGQQIEREKLKKWIEDWNGVSHANYLRPYCMVIVYWLHRRLNRA